MHEWNISVDIFRATKLIEGSPLAGPDELAFDGYQSTVYLTGELGIPFCADVIEFNSGEGNGSRFEGFMMKPHSLSPTTVNASGVIFEFTKSWQSADSIDDREAHEELVSSFVDYWASISHITGLTPELWVIPNAGTHVHEGETHLEREFIHKFALLEIDQLPVEQYEDPLTDFKLNVEK